MRIPSPGEISREMRQLSGWTWRAVETQHYALTRELVGSHADQERLEELLEGVKPKYRPEAEHLDYLLKTPFRYEPPKRGGSRFRRPYAPYGIFYGAERPRTALIELAFHRYRFFAQSPATDLPSGELSLTVFAAGYRARRALNLTDGELVSLRAYWVAPGDYSATQHLAERAVEGGVEVIRYESARDPETDARGWSAGRNLAILDPRAFDPPHHRSPQTWYLYMGVKEVNIRRAHGTPGDQIDLPRSVMAMPGPPQ